jgi:O-acetylserine/cysteine efflux transporter
MSPRHIALAVLVAAIWGFNFVVIHVGLESFPPILFTTLRFVAAALPALFVPRPKVGWGRMIAIGLALFAGQYVFLFVGMKAGMPPGLASIVIQSQAFFTLVIAGLMLGERPNALRLGGLALAFGGLGLIASTIGGDVTWIGLGLTLAAALSWALGNVLLKGAGEVDMFALVVWLSLVPPLPTFALALTVDGWATLAGALAHASLLGWAAVGYIAFLSTLLAFGLWADLIRRYSAGLVAPFSLLVPIFGAASAHLVLGEDFGPARLGGMALILLGLAVVALPWGAIGVRLGQGRLAQR